MPRNKIIPYDPKLKTRARHLRKNSTLSEILLWQQIKNKALGVQFHRQVPLDKYIVDFYCHELMLAIEIDGPIHDHEEVTKYDLRRQKRLESLGVQFLRFDDFDIKTDIPAVLKSIESWIKECV